MQDTIPNLAFKQAQLRKELKKVAHCLVLCFSLCLFSLSYIKLIFIRFCLEADEEKQVEKIEKKRKKEQEKLDKPEAKPKTKRPRKKTAEAESTEVGAEAKEAETESNKRRRSKPASMETPSSQAEHAKVDGETASPKALPKSKAGAKKSKAKHVAEDPAGASAPEPTDDKPDMPDKTDLKAKRREKAAQSWGLLKKLEIPDLYMPAEGDLGERISYTTVDPNKEGSSIYVVLASSNFFVTKTVEKSKWPSACSHLKVHHACLRVHLPHAYKVFVYIYIYIHLFKKKT